MLGSDDSLISVKHQKNVTRETSRMITEQWAGRRWAQRCQQPFSKLISKGVRLGDGSSYSLTETLTICVQI